MYYHHNYEILWSNITLIWDFYSWFLILQILTYWQLVAKKPQNQENCGCCATVLQIELGQKVRSNKNWLWAKRFQKFNVLTAGHWGDFSPSSIFLSQNGSQVPVCRMKWSLGHPRAHHNQKEETVLKNPIEQYASFPDLLKLKKIRFSLGL